MTRRVWGRLALGALVVALPLGRWLALRSADRVWAESTGVVATHTAIANLRVILLGLTFTVAAVWAVGNLYFLYRSIGSVHVPRRLGNIEILEAVPRRYLQVIMLALGGVIAAGLSIGARDWWREFALLGSSAGLGDRDPVLGREIGYYLFTLPWQDRVVGFFTRLTGTVLVVTTALHTLIGAVRWTGRRLETTDLARAHLAIQLATLAAVLFVGFRLDPSEYVAGLKNVPYDAILMDIRLPVAALLSGLALASGITALAWIRIPRVAVTAVPWGALAVVAVVGTYFVPGFAAAARGPEQRVRRDLVDAQRGMLASAFGMRLSETEVQPPATLDVGMLTRHGSALSGVPVWDPPILRAVLAGSGLAAPDERWTEPALSVYRARGGQSVPLFIAVRERDLVAARQTDPDLSWRQAHAGPRAYGGGAVAVSAGLVYPTGMPAFVPDLSAPDSSTPQVTDLALAADRIAFSPAAEPFAVREPTDAPSAGTGVPIRGPGRRLAFAWALQTTRLLSRDAVPAGSVLLWPRGIADRLERFAPFARFGAPYPVIVNARVLWLASGYVSGPAFPLSVAADFGGRRVRYVGAGLLGVVDASDGHTSVYLLPESDPLSRAWAALAPDVVQVADRLPPAVAPHVRYPEELLALQLPLALGGGAGGLPRLPARGGSEDPPATWLPAAVLGGAVEGVTLHAVAHGASGSLEATVDGVMERGAARLVVTRLREPVPMRPASVPEDAVAGRTRALVFADGVVRITPAFIQGGADGESPRFRELTLETGDAAARGATLPEALTRLRALIGTSPGTGAQWAEARRWFVRMDHARRSGDWVEFGRAWRELERLLGAASDRAR